MFKAEYLFARILLPFLTGIIVFYFYQVQLAFLVLAIISAMLLCLILLVNSIYIKFNAYKFKGLAGLTIILFFFAFGGLLCLLNSEKLKPDYFARKKYTHMKIYVNDEPKQTNGIITFKARVISGYQNLKQIKLSGQLLVALKADKSNPVYLKYGDEIIIYARYHEVEPPYNPAEFNFKRWLAGQNIYRQTFINQNQLFKTTRNTGNSIIKLAINVRQKQIDKYRKLIKDDEAFAVASTLILGYRADLSKETLSAYAKTGTIHALSVSGSHVAIIFFLLDFLLAFLNKKQFLKIVKFIIICSLIWVYALITGLSPSVVRSAIMITIFIIAKTFSKHRNGYNILAFSAFCQLIYNPFLIWDVGFQLSYSSVFGLIYLQPKIYNWIYIKNRLLNKIWELVALSLAAQCITFPLGIYYFHQFPVYFILGNLFISIPLILIMILGMAVLIPFTDKIYPVFEWVIVLTNSVLRSIANLPYSTFSSVWINIPELILLSMALGIFVYALVNYNKKFLILSLLVYIAYLVLIICDDWIAAHQNKIIFFTLRKNYAAAFISGRKAVLITGLTEKDKNYQFFIMPALEQSGINKIDFIRLNQDTSIRHFIKKDHQIIFNNYTILLIDEQFNHKKIDLKGKFSSIWLTGNSKFKPKNLPVEVEYKSILIDATNKDYIIQSFKNFAENNSTEVYILKKNPAYLIYLTQ